MPSATNSSRQMWSMRRVLHAIIAMAEVAAAPYNAACHGVHLCFRVPRFAVACILYMIYSIRGIYVGSNVVNVSVCRLGAPNLQIGCFRDRSADCVRRGPSLQNGCWLGKLCRSLHIGTLFRVCTLGGSWYVSMLRNISKKRDPPNKKR
jgi:hypothetical protein